MSPLRDDRLTLPSGRTIAFATWGDPSGAPVLFFHGTSVSRLFCPDAAATARAGVHLVSFDRPGVGGSDPLRGHSLADAARDVLAFTEALGLRRFGLAAWSGGAWYAAACAAIAPERLTGVALVAGGAGPFDEVEGRAETLREEHRDVLDRVRRLGPLAATEELLSLASVRDEANHPDTLASLAEVLPSGDRWLLGDPERSANFDSASREAFRQGVEGVVEDRVARFAPWGFRPEDIAAPVHLFCGAEDAIYPPERAGDWARRIPGARRTTWDDAGHFGLSKRWAEVLAAAVSSV